MMFLRGSHFNRSLKMQRGIECFSCGVDLCISDEDRYNRLLSKDVFIDRCISCSRDLSISSVFGNKMNLIGSKIKEVCIRYSSSSKLKSKLFIIWGSVNLISIFLIIFDMSILGRSVLIIVYLLFSVNWIMEILSLYFVYKTYGKAFKSD